MNPSRQRPFRRIASHAVLTPEGQRLTLQVVEIGVEGEVLDYYPLTRELPMTEWTHQAVQLKYSPTGRLLAYLGDDMIE